MDSLKIRRIRVRKGALDIELSCALDSLHVTQLQAQRALDLFPNLARHVCVNEREDGRFGAEIVGTELPHLLEHLVIELQAQADRQAGLPPRSYTGHTSWFEELALTASQGYALMRTTVTFHDDFVALRALEDALRVVELLGCG